MGVGDAQSQGMMGKEAGSSRLLRGFDPDGGVVAEGFEPDDVEGVEEGPVLEVEIDLQVLANKVIDLFRQELRVERERLVRSRPW